MGLYIPRELGRTGRSFLLSEFYERGREVLPTFAIQFALYKPPLGFSSFQSSPSGGFLYEVSPQTVLAWWGS